MFLDEIEKMKYYKNKISANLIELSEKAESVDIERKIKDIDSRLSIFQYIQAKQKGKFNVDKFNEDMEHIYQDLLILYRLCLLFQKEKFRALSYYAQAHLMALEKKAAECHEKTIYESNSTTFGKTLYFKANDFDVAMNNGLAMIDIGEIEASESSKLAFLCEGYNFRDKDVEFRVDKDLCTNFRFQRDYYKVGGKNAIKKYVYVNTLDIAPQVMQPMLLPEIEPTNEKAYMIYAGKDSIKKTSENKSDIVLLETGNTTQMSGQKGGRIEFYILDGTYALFDFNKAPKYKNFTDVQIDNLDSHHKVVIDYEPGFAFSVSTNGTIFADKQRGIVKDKKLFYPTTEDHALYLIEEYSEGNKKKLPVKVIIKNIKDPMPIVKHIAIKQLTALDEVANK